jgi:hypothetical protein
MLTISNYKEFGSFVISKQAEQSYLSCVSNGSRLCQTPVGRGALARVRRNVAPILVQPTPQR